MAIYDCVKCHNLVHIMGDKAPDDMLCEYCDIGWLCESCEGSFEFNDMVGDKCKNCFQVGYGINLIR